MPCGFPEHTSGPLGAKKVIFIENYKDVLSILKTDITPQELIAILAVFLETRSIDDSWEKPDISRIGLGDTAVDIIYNILDTANYFGESEYNDFKLDYIVTNKGII